MHVQSSGCSADSLLDGVRLLLGFRIETTAVLRDLNMGVRLTAQRARCKGCLNRKHKEDPELLLGRLVAAAEEVSKQRNAYKRFVETMPVLCFAALQREAGAAAAAAEAAAAATAQATAASAGSSGPTKSGTQQQLQQQQKRQGGKKEAAEGAAVEAAPTQNLSQANPRKEDLQYAAWFS